MSELVLRVYGDSLSMPRIGDGIPCNVTYPELAKLELEKVGHVVRLYNRSRGGVTIRELAEQSQSDSTYFGEADRTVFVIQCGVVDCAPRPVPPTVRDGISKLPGRVRRRVIEFLHSHRSQLVRLGPPWRETAPDAFRKTLSAWLASTASEGLRTYIFNVVPTTEEMDSHSPGFSASIRLYNDMLRTAVSGSERARLLDVHTAISTDPGGMARYVNPSDGHHISAEGHLLYSRMLLDGMASDRLGATL